MKVLITGTAGFIGYHVAKKMLQNGFQVIGIDNLNEYYSTELKFDRLNNSGINTHNIEYNIAIKSTCFENYIFYKIDICDSDSINNLFSKYSFDLVIHLAAQAGVRYSIENPKSYIRSNIDGFLNLLESSKLSSVKRILYASSSSVYGLSEKEILSVDDNTDKPVSLYAATKKSNELMAHVYSHLYNIETIGLRFFTVYGPWGRPDMAPFLFANAILHNKEINVFNHGEMRRDFTYIDDITEAIFKISQSFIFSKHSILNIGNNNPINLIDFISCLENEIGITAKLKYIEMQPGDVVSTWADTKELISLIEYSPKTQIETGVKFFIDWYRKYFKI